MLLQVEFIEFKSKDLGSLP